LKRIFADASYWIALINPKDQWRGRAVEASRSLGATLLLTTDEVLIEVLNYFADRGDEMRRAAAINVQEILLNRDVAIIPSSHDSFTSGLSLYQARLDKGYSLTDCISMNTMRELALTDVLTSDHHFTQEGFHILL
jgi:predicted nucleic acid-binding protein